MTSINKANLGTGYITTILPPLESASISPLTTAVLLAVPNSSSVYLKVHTGM